jgi:hypothetical protein
MIYTSNFREHGKHPAAVAISRGVPKGYTGLRYLALAPSRIMLKLKSIDDFYQAYQCDVLEQLEPQKVWDDLHRIAGPEPIMLCWEPFGFLCHRRICAEWLEQTLGVTIPEIDHDRADSLPWREMPPKPPSTRWKKRSTGPHQGSLFGLRKLKASPPHTSPPNRPAR